MGEEDTNKLLRNNFINSKGGNKSFREYLWDYAISVDATACVLEPGHCDEAIIGVDDNSGLRVVYDYDELVGSYAKQYRKDAKDDDDAYQMAVDWVEYNTLRSLPYMVNAPIVIKPIGNLPQ